MTIGNISNTTVQVLSNSKAPAQAVPDAEVNAGNEASKALQEAAAEIQQSTPELPAEEEQQSQDVIKATVSNINDYVQNLSHDLKFEMAEDGNRTIIHVINPETKEIIRQIPPEEVLAISEAMQQHALEGLLITTKA